MATSFIPSREAEMDNWINNFKTLIAAGPATYGLTAPEAASITAAYNAWHAAYLAATNPTTRTKATVATKNEQKMNVLLVVRGFAATIQANKAVGDALKIGLGLRPHDAQPTPVPPPSTYPLLTLTGMGTGTQKVRVADQETPTKRARPAGTVGVLVFRAVGPAPVTDPEGARFLGFVTKAEFESTFSPSDNGKTATYFARWTNSKGELGPWSQPATMPIAA
jgi:hypothetical protein